MAYVTVYFFVFKQKTAYEMRFRDWSSDVCSSDLGGRRDDADRAQAARAEPGAGIAAAIAVDRGGGGRDRGGRLYVVDGGRGADDPIVRRRAAGAARDRDRARGADLAAGDGGGANGVSWSGGLTRGARCIIVAV